MRTQSESRRLIQGRAVALGTSLLCSALSSCVPNIAAIQQDYALKTGLHIDSESKTGALQSKIHRGYPVVVQTKAADVWGRWSAKLAESEINDFLKDNSRYRVGHQEYYLQINDDEYERSLAEVYGQPISLVYVLKHENEHSPRLDIVSRSSVNQPDHKLQKVASIGGVFSDTMAFGNRPLWGKIAQSKPLMDRLPRFRRYYIRLDEQAVTFMFAGTETEYAFMSNEFPSYADFTLAVMDSLADIADMAKDSSEALREE